MAKYWYSYNGPCPSRLSNYSVTSNYSYINASPVAIETFCTGGACLCAIYATGVAGLAGKPNNPLSDNIISYIGQAIQLESSFPQPAPYVFTQPFEE